MRFCVLHHFNSHLTHSIPVLFKFFLYVEVRNRNNEVDGINIAPERAVDIFLPDAAIAAYLGIQPFAGYFLDGSPFTL